MFLDYVFLTANPFPFQDIQLAHIEQDMKIGPALLLSHFMVDILPIIYAVFFFLVKPKNIR